MKKKREKDKWHKNVFRKRGEKIVGKSRKKKTFQKVIKSSTIIIIFSCHLVCLISFSTIFGFWVENDKIFYSFTAPNT